MVPEMTPSVFWKEMTRPKMVNASRLQRSRIRVPDRAYDAHKCHDAGIVRQT